MTLIPCENCGKKTAVYVCSGCGGRVCSSCINLDTWKCKRCEMGALRERPELYRALKWITPEVLFLLSFIVISVGAVFIALATLLSDKTGSFGAIFLIGPIPIIFGSGPQMLPILILALMVMMCTVILFLYLYRKRFLI